jgi:hypothetical protein
MILNRLTVEICRQAGSHEIHQLFRYTLAVMKRVGREPQKLETLNLFSVLQAGDGRAIYDPVNRESFLAQVDAGLTRALDSEATLHGIRVQSLFRGLVANLDSVRLLKEEDTGDCYYRSDDDMLVPDFRVVTDKGTPMLIETKNHFSKHPMKCYRIRAADLDALGRYADLIGISLRFTIYWAPWNLWTLNDPRRFTRNGNYAEIELFRALKENEMSVLGDYSIGTMYPLTLRLTADMNKPREILPDGTVSMWIGGSEIKVDDILLEDKIERNIAFYLMMYGKWHYDGGHVEVDGEGLPVAVVHTVSPEETTPNQGFEIIGSLSSLYSHAYNFFTLEDGRVTKINLKEPASLAPVIPRDLKKKQLPLWRFILEPNYELPDLPETGPTR